LAVRKTLSQRHVNTLWLRSHKFAKHFSILNDVKNYILAQYCARLSSLVHSRHVACTNVCPMCHLSRTYF